MKILNRTKKSFQTVEGTILPDKLVEVSDILGAKLLKMYPGEIVDLESASSPYKAEAEKPQANGENLRKKQPAPAATAAKKAAPAPAEKSPAAPAEPTAEETAAAAKEARLHELLNKPELTEDEAAELKTLDSE